MPRARRRGRIWSKKESMIVGPTGPAACRRWPCCCCCCLPPLLPAACCCHRGRLLPIDGSGPSGPAPLDGERLLFDGEKGANNNESSAAKARFRLFQMSETITSTSSGGRTRASSIAGRAAVARPEKSPEQACSEHHQLLKSRAHVRFENLKYQQPSTSIPAPIGAGLAPLPGAQTRRSPNVQKSRSSPISHFARSRPI
jgi:hypothetical protein